MTDKRPGFTTSAAVALAHRLVGEAEILGAERPVPIHEPAPSGA